jgi:hypothetical protein
VTAAQETGRRIHVDDIWYARLGYGTVFGDRSYGTPAVGFAYRAELDRLAIDISFLNFQIGSGDHRSPGASAASWVRLSGLHFLNPTASLTAYFGGGLSYGRRRISRSWNYTPTGPFSTDWEGGGLQGELTVGYEIARATNLRLFVQADAVLPFFQAWSETYSRSGHSIGTDGRYAPSLVVSLGLGR